MKKRGVFGGRASRRLLLRGRPLRSRATTRLRPRKASHQGDKRNDDCGHGEARSAMNFERQRREIFIVREHRLIF